MSGPSTSIGMSWSYSISDIEVYNRTSVHNNVLDIDHDINESKNVGKTTCTVEPGKLVRVDEGAGYHSTDTYKAQFCHKYFGIYGAHNDTASSYVINF